MSRRSRSHAYPQRQVTVDEALEILLRNLRRANPSPEVLDLIREVEADLESRRVTGRHRRAVKDHDRAAVSA